MNEKLELLWDDHMILYYIKEYWVKDLFSIYEEIEELSSVDVKVGTFLDKRIILMIRNFPFETINRDIAPGIWGVDRKKLEMWKKIVGPIAWDQFEKESISYEKESISY